MENLVLLGIGVATWAGCGFTMLRWVKLRRPVDARSIVLGWFGGAGCALSVLESWLILSR